MADIKITDLAAYTAPTSTDVLVVVDVGNDITKKVSIADLLENAGSGAVATPGFAFDGDNDTGIYRPGTNQVAISAGGTQALLAESTGITIPGNLTVSGTTTTIDTTTLVVEDKNIEIGKVSTPSDTTADGGGITLKGATDKTITWVNSTDCWTFNQSVDVGGKVLIDSAGKIGINTASPSNTLHVKSANSAVAQIESSTAESNIHFHNSTNSGAHFGTKDGRNFFWYQDSSEKMRLDSSGRLLVGTTTEGRAGATDTLTIAGSADSGITIRSGTTGDGAIDFSDGTSGNAEFRGQILYDHNSDAMRLMTASAERMRIDSTGRVLIGTTTEGNPNSDNLTVADTGACGITVRSGTSSNGGLHFSDGTSGNNEFRGYVIYEHNTNALRLGTDAVEAVRIDSSGNVGIGETSASANLVVKQSGNAFTAQSQTVALFQRSSTTGHGAKIAIVAGTGGSSDINFGDTADEDVGIISYIHTNNSLTFTTNTSERMRIDSSGNVGIGTSSPQYLLQLSSAMGSSPYFIDLNTTGSNTVGGGSGISFDSSANNTDSDRYKATIAGIRNSANNGSNDLVFSTTKSDVNDNKPVEKMRIDSDGNVGIGTGSNLSRLTTSITHSNGAVAEAVRITTTGTYSGSNSNNAGPAITFGQFHNVYPNWKIAQIAGIRDAGSWDGALVFYTNTGTSETDISEKMRIDSSGNVGIGTTSPENYANHNTLTITGTTGGVIEFKSGTTKKGTIYNNANDFYVQTRASTNLIFSTADVERMRVDSSGRVGIGTSSPQSSLSVAGAIPDAPSTQGVHLGVGSNYASIQLSASTGGVIDFSEPSVDTAGRIIYTHSTDAMEFGTASSTRMTIDGSGNLLQYSVGTLERQHRQQSSSAYTATNIKSVLDGASGYLTFHTNTNWTNGNATERMRIDTSGVVLIGKTENTFANAGVRLHPTSDSHFTRDGGNVIAIRRNTNDGTLLDFYQDGSSEGNISVSGSTVSLNGGHLSRWSQLAGGAERIEILRGSVLSNLDEMCEWGDEDNEQLNRMKVSDTEGDKNVSGVFQSWDDDDDTYTNDFYCAMTGDFVIRIAQGTTVARGDLLMSAGDGTAKPQDDDIVRSKTVAKVTSTTVSTTYADGSYCVPCVLMAC